MIERRTRHPRDIRVDKYKTDWIKTGEYHASKTNSCPNVFGRHSWSRKTATWMNAVARNTGGKTRLTSKKKKKKNTIYYDQIVNSCIVPRCARGNRATRSNHFLHEEWYTIIRFYAGFKRNWSSLKLYELHNLQPYLISKITYHCSEILSRANVYSKLEYHSRLSFVSK